MFKVCKGCVGRGTGTHCFMCGGRITRSLRRTRSARSEVRVSCADCRAGRTHTHR